MDLKNYSLDFGLRKNTVRLTEKQILKTVILLIFYLGLFYLCLFTHVCVFVFYLETLHGFFTLTVDLRAYWLI